jgi:GNAT superfamily N-acetyltransferase
VYTRTDDTPFTYPLGDGGRLVLRPIVPGDRERLQAALGWMSEESRYTRFFVPLHQFSDEHLRYLTEVDQVDHVAWGALDPAAPHVPGAGVGRFIRLRDEPDIAEVAIAVVDAYQGRLVGTALFALLYLLARRRGVRTLRAVLLMGRSRLGERLRLIGGRGAYRDGVLEIDVPVHQDLARLRATPAGEKFLRALEGVRRACDATPGRGPLPLGTRLQPAC